MPARSAAACAAIAVPSLSVGFAIGWFAARSEQAVLRPSSRLVVPASDVQSLPPPPPSGVPACASSSADDEARALLTRVYPLYGEGTNWETIPLKQYRVILLTGPQRSGTTWAACALASQLGFTLFDERHPLTGGNDTLIALRRAFAFAREQTGGAVIQSPMATSVLHELPLFNGLAVLFLARNCLDVFRSQNRVMPHRGGWTCVAGRTKELRKYRRRPELTPHFDERDLVCTIKQHVWRRYQRPLLEQRATAAAMGAKATIGAVTGAHAPPPLFATLAFDSFRSHPMWRGSEQRANLTIKMAAGGCDAVVRAATPMRNRNRVREWIAVADAAVRRSEFL